MASRMDDEPRQIAPWSKLAAMQELYMETIEIRGFDYSWCTALGPIAGDPSHSLQWAGRTHAAFR